MSKIGRPRNPDGVITREGYRRFPKDATGEVYEHRQIGRKLYPLDENDCHYCGRIVLWSESGKNRLIIDHVDADRLNNVEANLVVACETCNLRRGKGLPV